MFQNPIIQKFGGTSVGTPERVRNVAELVARVSQEGPCAVIVSAFGGVTDRLLAGIEAALHRTGEHADIVQELRIRHQEAIQSLASDEDLKALAASNQAVWNELSELLDGIFLLRECTPRTRDAIMGLGERASAPALAATLRSMGKDAVALDARNLFRTDDRFGEAAVEFAETRRLTQAVFADWPATRIAVVTGFIASTERGVQTTLGRSGSDYSATILAGALDASRVEIWTDVDGVLSADPRLVPAAFTLDRLSYREAAEMAYFGAKVLHPRTMRPLERAAIPLYIKNTLNPEATGTLIHTSSDEAGPSVKAVTAVRNVALIMLEGGGMVGVPGISGRTFGALADADVNVLLISQASSEQSICIGVGAGDAVRAVTVLRRAFELELVRGDISEIRRIEDCAVVSLVGDRMRMQPGLAGRMFSTLGYANINVLAIAQGAAETNISAVVSGSDVGRALRALHEAFARSYERAHVFLVGVGVVGREFLKLIERYGPGLSETRHLNLRMVGAANSRRMVWEPDGLEPDRVLNRLESDGEMLDLDRLTELLQSAHVERLIVVDATASQEIADRYDQWLSNRIAVVTPNKRANTGPQEVFDRLHTVSARNAIPFRYETTVGAALPIIATLEDLMRSGDQVRSIEGVLSGTLAFVFNALGRGESFSNAVAEARQAGYTEPDPRDDLGGEDVARKILTLARIAGWRLERTDIQVEPLVPPGLDALSVDEFMARLPEGDADWRSRAKSGTLQYIAKATPEGVSVEVQSLEADSPFASISGTDNMVVFTTDRYLENPLVVRGAGAGPVVTAGGVMADVVRAAESMR